MGPRASSLSIEGAAAGDVEVVEVLELDPARVVEGADGIDGLQRADDVDSGSDAAGAFEGCRTRQEGGVRRDEEDCRRMVLACRVPCVHQRLNGKLNQQCEVRKNINTEDKVAQVLLWNAFTN